MRKLYLTVCFVIWANNACFSQSSNSKIPDSLLGRDYDYFIEQLSKHSVYPLQQHVYARAYLRKAKTERNWEETMYAYKELLHLSPANQKLFFADSMVIAAFRSKDQILLGSAYLTKGIILYSDKKYTDALNNYLIANNIILKTNDRYLLHKIKFNIAQLKYFVGDYTDAVGLLRECIAYFEKEDKEPYINSLHALAMCYVRIKQYALATATNELGTRESVKAGYGLMVPYFKHAEGINQYYIGNYAIAIKNLAGTLQLLQQKHDFANKAVADFYIGKSYVGLKKIDLAIPYFMKIDTAFREKKYVRQDFRESYEFLIAYYKRARNEKLELLYANRLLSADSLLDSNDKYVSIKLAKEYDHKALRDGNATLEEDLRSRHIWIVIFIVSTVLGILGILYLWKMYSKNRELFNHRYAELLNKKTADRQKKSENDLSDLSPEVLETIIIKLKKFENDKKFLERGLTQVKLARRLNTNTTYLSRIVYYHSGEKFSDYLNNLKIEHIVSLLKSGSRYRRYTNKALGEEAGFKSTQNFVVVFKKKMGVSPGEYGMEHNGL